MRPWIGMSRQRLVLVAAIGALLLAVVASGWIVRRNARPPAPSQDLGPVRATLTSEPAAPRVGENTLTVELADLAGRPVRGAEVEAIVFMAQMGSMPYMESRMRGGERRPGRYEGAYSPPMAGQWEVDLRIKLADGRRARGAYRLTVGRPGIAFAGSDSQPDEDQSPADSSNAAPSGAVRLDGTRRQEIGVTTALLARRDLSYERRTVGIVAYDERRQAEVAVKVAGWVRDLRADFEGAAVRRGQVLFTLYSPELYAAQQEYVIALQGVDEASSGAPRERALELAGAARQRLLLWDVPAGVVRRIEDTRRVTEAVPVLSPASGIVTEKRVLDGSPVMPGAAILRIVALSPVWVQAQVYPHELALLRVGQRARVQIPEGGAMVEGRIAFIDPQVDAANRTARVRIELANLNGLLKPGMFVDVDLVVPLGVRLAAPMSAVLRTGTRDIVYVDAGGGSLEPREVRLGRKAGDFYEVLAGLREGERIVTSGTFLVGAESRLRSAVGGSGNRP